VLPCPGVPPAATGRAGTADPGVGATPGFATREGGADPAGATPGLATGGGGAFADVAAGAVAPLGGRVAGVVAAETEAAGAGRTAAGCVAAAGRDGFDFAAAVFTFSVQQRPPAPLSQEMLPHKLGMRIIDRARMRLLLGAANFRQVLDQNLCFDLEFPGQLIYSDLIRICHQPLSLQSFTRILLLVRFLLSPRFFSASNRMTSRFFARSSLVSAVPGESKGSAPRASVSSADSGASPASGRSEDSSSSPTRVFQTLRPPQEHLLHFDRSLRAASTLQPAPPAGRCLRFQHFEICGYGLVNLFNHLLADTRNSPPAVPGHIRELLD